MALNYAIIKPNIILEIEGVDYVFTVTDIYRKLRLDEGHFLDTGLRLDSSYIDPSALKYIDVRASALSLSQQLFYDKSYVSSVQSLALDIIDKDLIVTKLLSPSVIIEDLLSRKAKVYLSYDNAVHPDESHPILEGVVEGIDAGIGSVKIRVSHPDGLKRQEIFPQISSELTDTFRYRCKFINGVKYQAQDQAAGDIKIRLIIGGTAGSEAVSVAGNTVTVTIANGVSTASQVVRAINNSQPAVNLIDASTIEDQDGYLQVAVSETTLDSSTVIEVETTSGLLLPSEDASFKTYVQIDDEIIEYTGLSETQITGLSRAQFGTIGRTSDVETEVKSFYRIAGSMKDLALKMMLSGGKALSQLWLFIVAPILGGLVAAAFWKGVMEQKEKIVSKTVEVHEDISINRV
ncbi:MAG: hypothetical protein AAGB31_11755 [Bdellovibrio sp.]